MNMVRLMALTALVAMGTAGLAMAQQPPFPPRRPPGLDAAAPSATAPARPAATTAPAAAGAPISLMPALVAPSGAPPAAVTAVAAPAGPLSEAAALERVNEYMNSFRTLIADFTQFSADGRKYQGKLYVHRPGKMRFEYRPPATIEVISDGTTVAVRDKRLATQDNYLIGQTPLKFLLKEQIDLKRDVKVLRVVSTPEQIRVTIEDRATLGGTSRITLHYDPKADKLTQWVIVDPQGYETSVQVANLETGRRPDPGLFRINLERILDTNN